MHAGRKLTFVSIHPYTPFKISSAATMSLELIAERLTKKPVENLVLLGDFNAQRFIVRPTRKLVHALGLRNAREGYGIYLSWPAFNPTPMLRIPIDHTLVKRSISMWVIIIPAPISAAITSPTITEIAVR